jgi:hypothetical protein
MGMVMGVHRFAGQDGYVCSEIFPGRLYLVLCIIGIFVKPVDEKRYPFPGIKSTYTHQTYLWKKWNELWGLS